MSYQIKRAIVSLVTNVLVFTFYYIHIMGLYQERNVDLTGEFKFWGAVILILIPVLIVAKIVIYILFSIIDAIITMKQEPLITDELDKLVDLKSTLNFGYVFIAGFLLAMGSLVMKMPPRVMFNIFLFSLITAGIVIDISQLYFYRRGI